ncbi:hypothetical protein L3X38_043429 [Prunus dulcis]|uniref:DDE Tnp4 domain-containing protein n=1 Tax=Prunus dulcis TaxID=3755 RepID=A0AAD4UX37_PRUDU|nr:hypothetical protein L3X38_043429 [Prunus dulcis]
MANMQEVLERQKRETRERIRRRAASKRVQRELDEQLGIAVALLDEENQSRCGSREGRGPNMDRHRHSRGKNLLEYYFIPHSLYSNVHFQARYGMQPHLFNKVTHDICNYDEYFVQKKKAAGNLGLLPEQKFTAVIRMLAYGSSADQGTTCAGLCPGTCNGFYKKLSLEDFLKLQKSIILEAIAGFDTWVWHAFFGVAGSQNDLNILGQSPVFNDVLRGEAPNITYEINNTVYHNGYYLADSIYPRWTTFVKSIPHPRSHKQKLFTAYQEGYRKNVERCFGILQAQWAIIRGAARLFDEEVLRSIMMTCIILHNMIV